MSGKRPGLSPLAARKQILIAESELNRAQLVQDWHALAEEVHALADQARTVRSMASAVASLVAGIASFRRKKPPAAEAKPSWWRTAWKRAQLVGSLWSEFRARP